MASMDSGNARASMQAYAQSALEVTHKDTPVNNRFADLEKLVCEAHGAIEELESMVEPVLSPPAPEVPSGQAPGRPPGSSATCHRLDKLAEGIAHLTRKIRRVTERVEL